MLSFNVVSLFTKVPIDQAINILRSRLQEDNKLDERTIFSPNDLCDLVELCVKSTYFCYQDQFYEQIEGASMGSPLSPILANTCIFMENLEDNAISTFKPSLWCRYIDDVFTLWPHTQQHLLHFKSHRNKQNMSIQFTTEEENNNKL